MEIRDFIESWIPVINNYPYYLIRLYTQEEIDQSAPLTVIPKPDTVIRMFFDHRGFYSSENYPELIVLVSPDHFDAAPGKIISADSVLLPTVYGEVPLASNLIEKLKETDIAIIDNKAFVSDHGIFAHTTFIKKYFPDTPVLPLLIHSAVDEESILCLVSWLLENKLQNTFFIASVDFSHYQMADAADFHDAFSYRAIAGFNNEVHLMAAKTALSI